MSSLYIVTVLSNLYAEYIMRSAGLDEAHAGIKIARRNISNLRYALPGESQGWGSLVGCRLWGRTESDTTEVT